MKNKKKSLKINLKIYYSFVILYKIYIFHKLNKSLFLKKWKNALTVKNAKMSKIFIYLNIANQIAKINLHEIENKQEIIG